MPTECQELQQAHSPKEMVNYSKNNILAQAGQSMLAQANQSNQGVLSLLQNFGKFIFATEKESGNRLLFVMFYNERKSVEEQKQDLIAVILYCD